MILKYLQTKNIFIDHNFYCANKEIHNFVVNKTGTYTIFMSDDIFEISCIPRYVPSILVIIKRVMPHKLFDCEIVSFLNWTMRIKAKGQKEIYFLDFLPQCTFFLKSFSLLRNRRVLL